MSEDFTPVEKVEPPCQILYLQSSSGKVYRCYRTSEADKVIAHHKYKRCLAMAEWCNSEMGRETFACFRPRSTKEVWREEHKYWYKWRKIWFKLYKKLKTNKSTAQ